MRCPSGKCHRHLWIKTSRRRGEDTQSVQLSQRGIRVGWGRQKCCSSRVDTSNFQRWNYVEHSVPGLGAEWRKSPLPMPPFHHFEVPSVAKQQNRPGLRLSLAQNCCTCKRMRGVAEEGGSWNRHDEERGNKRNCCCPTK